MFLLMKIRDAVFVPAIPEEKKSDQLFDLELEIKEGEVTELRTTVRCNTMGCTKGGHCHC